MDITTNRVDAMNHYGVAREVAAIYELALPAMEDKLPEARPVAKPFSVRIESGDACGRFTARVLRDVKIGDSRDWFPGAEVATYFKLLEQKQISNAVDATNFCCSPWASPRTSSTWTSSKAALWFGGQRRARNSKPSTAWSASLTRRT